MVCGVLVFDADKLILIIERSADNRAFHLPRFRSLFIPFSGDPLSL